MGLATCEILYPDTAGSAADVPFSSTLEASQAWQLEPRRLDRKVWMHVFFIHYYDHYIYNYYTTVLLSLVVVVVVTVIVNCCSTYTARLLKRPRNVHGLIKI